MSTLQGVHKKHTHTRTHTNHPTQRWLNFYYYCCWWWRWWSRDDAPGAVALARGKMTKLLCVKKNGTLGRKLHYGTLAQKKATLLKRTQARRLLRSHVWYQSERWWFGGVSILSHRKTADRKEKTRAHYTNPPSYTLGDWGAVCRAIREN